MSGWCLNTHHFQNSHRYNAEPVVHIMESTVQYALWPSFIDEDHDNQIECDVKITFKA